MLHFFCVLAVSRPVHVTPPRGFATLTSTTHAPVSLSLLLPPQASGTDLAFAAFACSFALSDIFPILLKSTKGGRCVRQNAGAELTPHYKKFIIRILMLVKVCEFAALGALCADGVTLPILQLHLGSYPKLVQILNMLPSELNVFQVINKFPLYHICYATAESHFFLFSVKMSVAEIKKWDDAFRALLIFMGFWKRRKQCTIFQELLDVKNPKNIKARKEFAVEASKRGKAHVKNGTGLWNVFHPALVEAGVINWGAFHVKKGTALWNVFHPVLVAAGVLNWGEIQGPLRLRDGTGIFDEKHDDKRQEWRSNGGKKGKGVKMGKGKKGTKVS